MRKSETHEKKQSKARAEKERTNEGTKERRNEGGDDEDRDLLRWRVFSRGVAYSGWTGKARESVRFCFLFFLFLKRRISGLCLFSLPKA